MSRLPFGVLQPALFHFDSSGSSVSRSFAVSVPSISDQPVDPMLLIYEERLRTVCLLGRWVGRALRSILTAAGAILTAKVSDGISAQSR